MIFDLKSQFQLCKYFENLFKQGLSLNKYRMLEFEMLSFLIFSLQPNKALVCVITFNLK